MEQGTVVAVEGQMVWVETTPRSSCSHCSSDGCSSAVLSKLFGARRNRLVLVNCLDVRPGDPVIVGIAGDALIRASLLSYLLPLVVMVSGALIGSAMELREGFQGLLAAAGLAAGFFLAGRISRCTALRQRLSPRLLRPAEADHGGTEIQIRRGTGNE